MALNWTVSFTGQPNDFDKQAAIDQIEQLNDEIEQANMQLDSGEELTPYYTYSTGAELKASYLAALAKIVANAHNSYIKQSKEKFKKELEDAVKNADENTQAQLRTLLGVNKVAKKRFTRS